MSERPNDETIPVGHERELIALARAATRTSPKAEPLPESIGPYRILQLLGEGGMGVVYLAEQWKPIHRRVALKLIRVGMDTHQVIARFEAEREALAVLDHPNVARVLDAGATEQGRPYFVMEHVSGVPIAQYCDDHRLNTEARLRLFMQVCHAVQHAHQKGIVHRDIKPSNVLVTEVDDSPVAKVIDFGIAKATQQPLTEKTLFTQQGQFIGTPAYMSPEQADPAGIDIDTRTDVYSLGVLLYELLVGTLPFDPETLRNAAFAEMQRLIREVDPPKPSSRLTGPSETLTTIAERRHSARTVLLKEIRGDLDWIVMKCLEKDRTRRYDTVSGLIAELQRHLDQEPVLAGPPSVSYRLRKFVRRNRLPVAAGFGVLLALSVGLSLAVTMYLRAERGRLETAKERDRANQEAQTAQTVVDFLVGVFKTSDPDEAKGNMVTARELLDRGAQHVRQSLANQPSVQARLLDTISHAYSGLGAYSEATLLLNSAYDIQRLTFGKQNVQTIQALGRLGELYWLQGRFVDAEQCLRDALASFIETGEKPSLVLAHILGNLGKLLRDKAEYDEAGVMLGRAADLIRDLGGDDTEDYARVMTEVASLHIHRGQYATAEPILRRAIATLEKQSDAETPLLAGATSDLGTVLLYQGRRSEAEGVMVTALRLQRRFYGEEHRFVATALNNLGALAGYQERYDRAEALLRESLAMRKKLLGETHPEVADTLQNLAMVLNAKGDFAGAEAVLREALPLDRELFGNEHPNVGMDLNSLGNALIGLREYETAKAPLIEAVSIFRKYSGTHRTELANTLGSLADVHRLLGDSQSALPLFEESLELWSQLAPKRRELVMMAVAQCSYGKCLMTRGRYDEAERALLASDTGLEGSNQGFADKKRRTRLALVALYESREAAEPGKGYAAKAAEWRAKLATLEAETERPRDAEPAAPDSPPVPAQEP